MRFRLRQQAAGIAITLARADRLNPPGEAEKSQLRETLFKISEELDHGAEVLYRPADQPDHVWRERLLQALSAIPRSNGVSD